MAWVPGEMNPCAPAAVASEVSAAAVSSAARKLWEGMIVLVAGPQGGAGASVQRGDVPGMHGARMVCRDPPEAGLAAEDGSGRVDVARRRYTREHVRCLRIPGRS